MSRTSLRFACLAALLLVGTPRTAAADWDLSLFLGRAFPTFDERLTIRLPAAPPIPGLEITPRGTPEIGTDGGPVYGIALAGEAGVIGIEGRLDVVDVDLDFTGAGYDLRFGNQTGSVTIGDALFETDRLNLWSLNLRLRTPGPVSFVVSGGLSYLPSFDISGTVPVQVDVPGIGGTTAQPRLVLRVSPEESDNKIGVNAGAGLRFGGRAGLFAEGRVFYFRSYELQADFDDAQPVVNLLLDEIDPIDFRPVIGNVVVGLFFRF